MGELNDELLGRAAELERPLITPEDYAARQQWWASPAGQAEARFRKENPVNGPMTLEEHEYAERVKYWNSPEGQERSAKIQAARALVEPQGYDDRIKYWESPEGRAESDRILAEDASLYAKNG